MAYANYDGFGWLADAVKDWVKNRAKITAADAIEARTLSERFADVINVKDFGAVGDGITDDTNAFKDAANTGRAVFVPQGNYNLSESVIGDFYSDGPISFSNIVAEVKCTTYAGDECRKSVRFLFDLEFADYDTAFATIQTYVPTATQLYPQACCHQEKNGEEFLYVFYQTMPSRSTTNAVVVFNITINAYIGYYILPGSYSGEGLAVVTRDDTDYIYACASSPFRITRYILAGPSGSVLTASEDDFANVPFSVPFFSRSDSGEWLIYGYYKQQPTAKESSLAIYNDSAELQSQIYWDTFDFDTLSAYDETDPDQMSIPHKQGLFYASGNLYLFAGGSSNLTNAWNVSNIGVIQKNLYGDTLRNSVCTASKFKDRLSSALGETIAWGESEGGYIYRDRVYSLNVIKNTDNVKKIVLIEDFSQMAHSVDFADCIAVNSNIPNYVNRRFYPRYNINNSYFKNPFTNANLTTLDDFAVMMAKYGLSELTVNLFGATIAPTLGGVSLAASATNQPYLVEFLKQSTGTVFVHIISRETGTAQDKYSAWYRAFIDTSTWTITDVLPLSLAIGCGLEMRGSSAILTAHLTGHTTTTAIAKFSEEGNNSILRLGRYGSTAGLNYIFLETTNEDAGEITSTYAGVKIGYDHAAPTADNAISLGTANERWSTIYAASGTIDTSDARLKTNIVEPSEALMRAWGRVRTVVFQFTESINKKGSDGARFHIGLVAQEVKEAFDAEGLDAAQYGLYCYDKWEAQDAITDDQGNVVRESKEKGDCYGIRYGEALALECAYQRYLGKKRDERLAAIEAQIGLTGEPAVSI